jgi:hypothetical protein
MSEPTVEAFGYRQELKRSLGLGDLLVYGLIFIVPGAPISVFGIVFNASGGMVPPVYIVGAIDAVHRGELRDDVAPLSGRRVCVRVCRPGDRREGRFLAG